MDFCLTSSSIWRFAGYGVLIIKIVIPIIIIVLGIVDLAKAVVSEDEKAINKAAISIAKRLIAGVAIFFIPTIVDLVVNLIRNVYPDIDNINDCKTCLLHPNSSECAVKVNTAKSARGK